VDTASNCKSPKKIRDHYNYIILTHSTPTLNRQARKILPKKNEFITCSLYLQSGHEREYQEDRLPGNLTSSPVVYSCRV